MLKNNIKAILDGQNLKIIVNNAIILFSSKHYPLISTPITFLHSR